MSIDYCTNCNTKYDTDTTEHECWGEQGLEITSNPFKVKCGLCNVDMTSNTEKILSNKSVEKLFGKIADYAYPTITAPYSCECGVYMINHHWKDYYLVKYSAL